MKIIRKIVLTNFLTKELSIKYVRKIFRKTNISNPLIRTVRNGGLEMLVFRKILRTYLMDDPQVLFITLHLLPLFHCPYLVQLYF